MGHQSLEFFKLDNVDKKVLFYLMDSAPDQVRAWVDHVVLNYASRNKAIDPEQLYSEVEPELRFKKTNSDGYNNSIEMIDQ